MPLPKPSKRLGLPSKPATCLCRPSQPRHFSQACRRRAGHQEDLTEPPTGWLWGVPPGEKYKKEGWEGLMFWGFGGSFLLTAIAYAFKPDTSIQTWALEEARRRLEVEGILEDPHPEK